MATPENPVGRSISHRAREPLYWLAGTPSGENLVVETSPLLGGPASLVLELPNSLSQNVFPGISQIGATQTTIFLTGRNAVQRFSIAGPNIVHAGPEAFCQSFASDDNAAYCDVGTGSNLKIASDGTSAALGPVVNPVGSDAFPYIVFDDTYAYWADNAAAGTIMKAPKAGGGTATVLAHDTSPTAIAVDAHSIYWADVGGYIKSIPK